MIERRGGQRHVRVGAVAIGLLLALAAVPAPSSASTSCPEAVITTPGPGGLVVSLTGRVSYMLHLCDVGQYSLTFRLVDGRQLATTGLVEEDCGHKTISKTIDFASVAIGPGSVVLLARACVTNAPLGEGHTVVYVVP